MARIRGMIAASLDGYAADAQRGVAWLEPFHDVDYGYEAFIAGIETLVMGRATFDQIGEFGGDWPYPGKRTLVVTSSAVPPGIDAARWEGTLPDLAAHLVAGTGDAWVVGGPRLQAAFLELGALDRLEVCIVPRLLGGGVPLFPALAACPRQPELREVRRYDRGLVMLDYDFA